MGAIVHTEHYQRMAPNAWRFNVYISIPDEGDGDFNFIQLGWGFVDDKLMAPYIQVKGRCYTMARVSKRIARGIYRHVIAEVSKLEGREIPYSDAGWKRCCIGDASFQKAFPKLHATRSQNASV
jgi:hypothetical protein